MPAGPTTAGPVIAGAAQVANHDEERIVHPVELLGEAAIGALAEAGLGPDDVGAVYATPLSVFTSDDASVLVADRLGLPAGIRVESSYSGAAPQRLLARALAAVADGTVAAALVVGGIADASVRRARQLGIDPPAPPTSTWSQGSGGVRDARLRAPSFEGASAEGSSGAGLPALVFALCVSALGGGVVAAARRARGGARLAPVSVAAGSTAARSSATATARSRATERPIDGRLDGACGSFARVSASGRTARARPDRAPRSAVTTTAAARSTVGNEHMRLV